MVARLHDGCHPAVLRQVHRVIEAGHAAGIWIGVCGELAGDQDAVPVLVGLGIDELSMTPASIPKVKAIVRRRTYAEAQRLAAEAIDLDSAEAVRALVHVRSGGDE
jgi:phosphoenolpyruvate-protein kinase (PTS system EI component)